MRWSSSFGQVDLFIEECGPSLPHAQKKEGNSENFVRQFFLDAYGDNNPLYDAKSLTTRADGLTLTPIPPYLGHSNPSSTHDDCYITSK